jgi:hypothetical protein
MIPWVTVCSNKKLKTSALISLNSWWISLGNYHWMSICRILILTMYKNQLKMNQGPMCKTWNYWTTGTKCKETPQSIGVSNDFLYKISRAHMTKAKIYKWDYIKLINFWIAKEKIKWSTTYRVEENTCQLFIWQRINIQNIWGTQRTSTTKNKYPIKMKQMTWIDISQENTDGQQVYEKYSISIAVRKYKSKP